MTLISTLLLARKIPVAHPVFSGKRKQVSCYIIFLSAVSGGKGRKEDPTYAGPWRDGCLFRPHDCVFAVKGECCLSEGKGGGGERRGHS